MRYGSVGHILHSVFRIKKELGEIYLNIILLTFAMALVAIFIPIYLLIAGFSITSVIFFAIIEWLVEGAASPLIAGIAARKGFKFTIFWRSPTLILLLGMVALLDPKFGLNVAGSGIEYLVLAGLGALFGFSGAIYWTLINAEFVKYSDEIHEGEEIGILYSSIHVAGIAAPFLGGLLLSSAGFGALFLLVSFMIIFSLAPLFMLQEYRGSIKFRLSDTSLSINRNLALFLFLDGMLMISENWIWPVYIFSALKNVLSVGIAGSLSGMGIAFITIFIGKITDRIDKKAVMKTGLVFYSLIWVARMFAVTPLEVFMISFLGGMLSMFVTIPAFAFFCDSARRAPINYSIFREFWLSMGRILVLAGLIALSAFLQAAFAMAAIACLLLVYIVGGFRSARTQEVLPRKK